MQHQHIVSSPHTYQKSSKKSFIYPHYNRRGGGSKYLFAPVRNQWLKFFFRWYWIIIYALIIQRVSVTSFLKEIVLIGNRQRYYMLLKWQLSHLIMSILLFSAFSVPYYFFQYWVTSSILLSLDFYCHYFSNQSHLSISSLFCIGTCLCPTALQTIYPQD